MSKLLQKAVGSHKEYTNMVMNGKGIDRHLLGLKLIALEERTTLPKLFSSAAYNRLFQFQISTSQVPTRHDLRMGFGPATKDGYAICYNPKQTKLLFSITAFNNQLETSALKFSKELSESLLIMRDICDKTGMLVPKPKI